MELKTYLRILLRKWWIILPISVITAVASYLFTINQPLVYESTTTFVMRPRSSIAMADDTEFVRAVDTLSRRVEINTTYTEVAKSNLIKQRAIERLNLSKQARRGLKVQSKVIAGTNVLEISAQGTDPVVVRDFTNAVGIETQTYTSNLYDIFELEPLDEAEIREKPINASPMLNVVVGGTLGLILGVVLALLAEYIFGRHKEPPAFNIIDTESGAYSKAYLKLRLQQEMSRARRNQRSFSLAIIELHHPDAMNGANRQIPGLVLRGIKTLIAAELRDEDILARLSGPYFALILPDTSGQTAKLLLQEIQLKMETAQPEIIEATAGLMLQTRAGVVVYTDDELGIEDLLAQANAALKHAKVTPFGRVSLFSPADTANGSYQQGGIIMTDYPQTDGQLSANRV